MMKLLLIDDDLIEHKILSCYITAGIGGPVMLESALDIETAQEFLETDTFDYVFLDDRFAPYRSALETLPLLKPFFGTAKVVIVSSCVAAEHLQDPEALGVTAVLNKSDFKDYVTETLKRQKREIADQQAA